MLATYAARSGAQEVRHRGARSRRPPLREATGQVSVHPGARSAVPRWSAPAHGPGQDTRRPCTRRSARVSPPCGVDDAAYDASPHDVRCSTGRCRGRSTSVAPCTLCDSCASSTRSPRGRVDLAEISDGPVVEASHVVTRTEHDVPHAAGPAPAGLDEPSPRSEEASSRRLTCREVRVDGWSPAKVRLSPFAKRPRRPCTLPEDARAGRHRGRAGPARERG